MQWYLTLAKAVGLKLHHGLMVATSKRGPSIMKSEDREIVQFQERDRQVINENDLEVNFDLVKEAIYGSLEGSLALGSKHEIPFLADFEVGCFGMVSLHASLNRS